MWKQEEEQAIFVYLAWKNTVKNQNQKFHSFLLLSHVRPTILKYQIEIEISNESVGSQWTYSLKGVAASYLE